MSALHVPPIPPMPRRIAVASRDVTGEEPSRARLRVAYGRSAVQDRGLHGLTPVFRATMRGHREGIMPSERRGLKDSRAVC
jgi:hypothetical protein